MSLPFEMPFCRVRKNNTSPDADSRLWTSRNWSCSHVKKETRLLGEAGLLILSLSYVELLKDIQDEVMPFVVRLLAGIKVVPVCIVDRNAAILRIPVVHVIVACRVPLEIMRIVHVGIVIKTVPVGRLSATGSMGLVGCKAGRY